MHYLEDYIEIIDYLPAELKSRFLQIRELDDHVQKQIDSLNDRCKTFFTLCRKNKQDLRDQQYQNLCQEYEKVMRDSSEKVKLANQLVDLMDRHMRRLDHDLNRFTIELEADTAGITEILEQKSYLLDRPPSPERPAAGPKRSRHSVQHDLAELANGDYDDFSPSPSMRISPAPGGRSIKYPRREKSTVATLNLSAEGDSEFFDLEEQLTSPSSFYQGSGGKPPLSFVTETKSHKKTSSLAAATPQQSVVISETVQDPITWTEYVDPNEPRYCLCNQVSYGEMVGCDNDNCPMEWFHYGCVGITEPPKGKWYCPTCSQTMRKKGSRKAIPQ